MSWEQLLHKAKIILPQNNDSIWANQVLVTDSLTDKFITAIKNKDFKTDGIDSTIAELRFWEENPKRNPFTHREISLLYQERSMGISFSQLVNRVNRILDEALPKLVDFRSGQKGAGGKKSRKYDISKESISSVLDSFEELSKGEQNFYLKHWNNSFSNKSILGKYQPYLTQKYSSMIKPFLRQTTLAESGISEHDILLLDARVVTLLSEDDLSKFNFNNYKKGGWKITVSKNDIKSLRHKLVNNDIQFKTFRGTGIPIVRVFGLVKGVDLKDTEYLVTQSFNSSSAVTYLNIISTQKDLFLPHTLKLAKKSSGLRKTHNFINKYLQGILDDKYELETFAEEFIKDAKKLAKSDAYLKHNSAILVFNAGIKGDTSSEWYWKDFEKVSFDKVRAAIYKELSARDGKFKEKFDAIVEKFNKDKEAFEKGITPSQKAFIELLIEEDIEDDLFDGLKDKKLIQQLKDNPPRFHPKPIKFGGESFTLFVSVEKEFIMSVFDMVDNLPDDLNLKQEWEDTQQEDEEVEQQISAFLETQAQEYEGNFNEEDFSSELEKLIAEIIYTTLESNERLDDVLSGESVFARNVTDGFNFTDLVNSIILLNGVYKTGDSLSKIIVNMEENKNEETFNLVNEIKEFTKTFKSSLPKLRSVITEDVKQQVQDVAEHPLHYKREMKKTGTNIFSKLKSSNIIEVKSNEI